MQKLKRDLGEDISNIYMMINICYYVIYYCFIYFKISAILGYGKYLILYNKCLLLDAKSLCCT